MTWQTWCQKHQGSLYGIVEGFFWILCNRQTCTFVSVMFTVRATVKAGTQERRAEHRMEVMWFHKGNYSEMSINGSFPAAISCNSTAILCRPSSLSLKNILDRSRDVFPLEPVNHCALTEVNITKRNSQLLPMQMSLSDFARLQNITTYMHEFCKVGIPISQRKRLGLYFAFLCLDEITIRVTIRPS